MIPTSCHDPFYVTGALLIDPFRTVVPAGAFPQSTCEALKNLSLHDAHCGTFFEVMPWDWLATNLPGYMQAVEAQPGLKQQQQQLQQQQQQLQQ